jgi:hypothetical protein
MTPTLSCVLDEAVPMLIGFLLFWATLVAQIKIAFRV